MNLSQGSYFSRGLAILILCGLGFVLWQMLILPAKNTIKTTSDGLGRAVTTEQQLFASIERLSMELGQAKTVDIEGVVWTAPKIGEVTAGIQAQLGMLATETNISVRSITSIPTQPIQSVETTGLRVEAEADLEQFINFLIAIEHHSPALVVNRSNIRRLNRVGKFSTQPVVFFQLDVIAPFRLEGK